MPSTYRVSYTYNMTRSNYSLHSCLMGFWEEVFVFPMAVPVWSSASACKYISRDLKNHAWVRRSELKHDLQNAGCYWHFSRAATRLKWKMTSFTLREIDMIGNPVIDNNKHLRNNKWYLVNVSVVFIAILINDSMSINILPNSEVLLKPVSRSLIE